jgi:hypothetical protein
MNVEIGTETPIFLFWEYLFRNFGILSLQCIMNVLAECAGGYWYCDNSNDSQKVCSSLIIVAHELIHISLFRGREAPLN